MTPPSPLSEGEETPPACGHPLLEGDDLTPALSLEERERTDVEMPGVAPLAKLWSPSGLLLLTS